MSFKQQDFINEPFPHQPDLILCRDMIQHNSLVDGVRAYYNMERSGAKYLATTWHQQGASPASVCALQGDPFREIPSGNYLCRVFFGYLSVGLNSIACSLYCLAPCPDVLCSHKNRNQHRTNSVSPAYRYFPSTHEPFVCASKGLGISLAFPLMHCHGYPTCTCTAIAANQE